MPMISRLHVPYEYYYLIGLGLERNFVSREDGEF